jgi:serine/threonine protein kinase
MKLDDNAKNRSGNETAMMLPNQIEATIEQAWGDVAKGLSGIDATIATEAGTSSPSKRPVVVSERRVRDTEQDDFVGAEYELLRVLGRGGMGVVYEARQVSIGRSVAVKMLRPENDADARMQQKFVAEAAVTGELDHPNIVPIYDLGQTSQGLLFYAMKQVRGTPWQDVIRERTVSENVRVLMRVADAMAFAHSRDIVHRDLKPENIMLGEFGEVLVMDWGLALVTTDDADSSAGMGGTPSYMAPEMVLGPPSAIGSHSDIYLLGAILYEIVTGAPPHFGKSANSCMVAAARNEITPTTRTDELVEIALRCLATRPADRFGSVQEFQAALREYESHIESIAAAVRAGGNLEQAKESHGYDRFAEALFGFQNAFDLWDGNAVAHTGLSETRVAYAETALVKGDYDLGLSIIDSPANENEELRQRLLAAQKERDARKLRLRSVRRMAASLAVGLVVVMGVALVSIIKAESRTRVQRDIAVLQQQLARDAVDQMLTEVGQQQLQDVPQMELVRRNLLNKALGFYLRFLEEQPDDPSVRVETAQAYHRVGEITNSLGQDLEAENAYRQAIVVFKQLVSEFPDESEYRQRLAGSQNFLGELYRNRGDSAQAEEQYLHAQHRQRFLVKNAPRDSTYRQELARTSYNLGLLYLSIARPEDARNAYDNAIEELQTLVESQGSDEKNQQGLARAYLNRGILNRGTERTKDAREDYDRAIALLNELTETSPTNAEYRLELATVFNNLGNLLLLDKTTRDEAEQVYRDGLTMVESLTNDFPNVLLYRKDLANSVNSLAALYYYNSNLDAAEQMWQRSRGLSRALVRDQPQVPENHSLLGRTLGNLGTLMFKRDEYEAARELLTKAIDSQQRALDSVPEHPEFQIFLRNSTWSLTEVHLALKDHESAAETAEKLPDILRDDPAELYRAASLVAKCVLPAAETANNEELSAIQMDYANRSTNLLARAVDQGFSDVEKLDADAAFASIRETEQYDAVRQRLADGDR